MSGNLIQLEKALRKIAKHSKTIKYTKGLLFAFIMMGMSAFSAEVTIKDKEIEQTKTEINDTVKDLKEQFRIARAENDKLLRNANLELIQLMEQGDQVVKSEWSSWQFGANYFYNNWNGVYKGRGDKTEKYPYEGIFTRSEDPYERYVSPSSDNYSLLPRSTNPRSASSNQRSGLPNGYGLASTRPVSEPIIAFEVSAGITPRAFTAPTVTPLQATQPNLPQAINFSPVTPNIAAPAVPTVTIATISPPGTGNGDDMWINSGGSVAPLAQIEMNGGTMNVAFSGRGFDLSTNGITMTGRQGAGHGATNHGVQNLNWTGIGQGGQYAAMKLVGGHEIKIDGVTINATGTGTSTTGGTGGWLFHTDGHNDRGESTWNIGTGSTINLSGNNLIMYTSQYHGNSRRDNIGFVNQGKINSTGSGNYVWIALDVSGNQNRVQYFTNKGDIILNGNSDVWVFMDGRRPTTGTTLVDAAGGGYTIINDGNLELNGNAQRGIIVNNKYTYPGFEILLNREMKVTGSDSIGTALIGWANLEGGLANYSGSNADNIIEVIPATSRESVFKMDLSGNRNMGLYFNHNTANPFVIGDYTLKSTNGTGNTLIFINDGVVTLKPTNTGGVQNTLAITGGSGNIGIFAKGSGDTLTTGADITIANSDNSTGIFAQNTGTVTNTGNISTSGASVKAIIADNTTVNSTGNITVNGTALSALDGSAGLVAQNGGTLNITGGTTNITVDGSASTGLYAGTGSTLNLTGGTVTTTGGAFNVFSNGTVNLANTTIDTGASSLAFMAGTGGRILFNNTTATISGGSNTPATRGTAFLYQGTGHSSFTAGDITTWAANTFGGTTNQLTLNMNPGSRLFIASGVAMNLSDTSGSTLSGALGANIVGTDYKTFMLYNSLLTLNQNINLDNPNDPYNQLELSNSSIDNNNNNNIIGTQAGQTAIAQENQLPNRAAVTINNNGNINLSGANSTGIYTKYGIINNNATGTITMGDTSTGIYGVNDSQITNTGVITVGSNSTGIYSENSTTLGVTNSGTISSAGTSSVGILYKPAATLAPGAVVSNTGTISMGDSSVGMYGENTATNYTLANSGNITVGTHGIAMLGYAVDVTGGTITVGNSGVGVYSQGGNVNLTGGTIATGINEAVAVYTVGSGQTITNSGTAFNLGNTSVAIANAGTGNTINSTVGNVSLGENNIYIYSNDTAGSVTNSTNLTASGNANYGIYSAGTVNSTGNMDFGAGIGNVGIYSIRGGTATNSGTITIGATDATNNLYGIGMAAGYSTTDTGNIINNGTINVNGANSIGMYATGPGSTATNTANINLNADGTIGVYADNGATVNNSGTITTGAGSYTNVVGVYLGTGSTLNNTGSITLNGPNAVGVYLKGGTIANYGNITVNGSTNPTDTVQSFATPPTSKGVGGVEIEAPAGAQSATIYLNGVAQTPVIINTFAQNPVAVSASSIGLYVNTSGKDYTNPITGLGNLTSEADLIIGMEATESTNSKYIQINDPLILDPYNNVIRTSGVANWNIYGGSLTWLATPTLDPNDGSMTNIYMAKIPYTNWAGKEATPVESTDTYNFLDGLEQRYGVEALGTREKALFDKLNSIGENEAILFYQATDEMMGHQYANTQQRINATGNILDKEFNYLRNDWSNPSKEANKIKLFGSREEYNTDTAGVIDYKSKSYGVAYVHEDETIKLGNSTGWCAGYVNNRFRFKDIGKSKENQNMLKAGVFKSKSFDDNGSLKWTISGEGFIGQNDMNRRYLVVDEIFNAKGTYYAYGLGLKNEISKEFRTSERTSIKPYGSLDLEYGRFNSIKEKDGEMRLEIKSNDYFSVKPELGVEFKYKQPMAVKTNLTASLGIAYENELGKVADGKNKGRVRYTSADWFNIRGEKEDRRGNFKADFKLGIENTRFGVTFNAGYDTKGENIRGGIGLRAIF